MSSFGSKKRRAGAIKRRLLTMINLLAWEKGLGLQELAAHAREAEE